MASALFIERFRNKSEKLGKTGLGSLSTLNPIEKGRTLEGKAHNSALAVLPSLNRIKIVKKGETQDVSEVLRSNRSITPSVLPVLKVSPGRVRDFGDKGINSTEIIRGVASNGKLSSLCPLPNLRSRLSFLLKNPNANP